MEVTEQEHLEISDRRDDLAADGLQSCDPVHIWDGADHRLDTHTGEPAQLPDQPFHLLTALADVEGESAGLVYLIVVPTFDLAVTAQDVELPRYLLARAKATGVGIAGNEAQGLFSPSPAIMIGGWGRLMLCGTLSGRSSR